jgi:transcriptional regulator with GAF, ATPase, and Fis domain
MKIQRGAPHHDDESTEHNPPSRTPVVGLTIRVAGDGETRVLNASTPSLRVGTARDNDLVLTDRTISRYHCRIDLGPHGFRLQDLSSTNGTYVNGIRVGQAAVDRATVMRIGNTELSITPSRADSSGESRAYHRSIGMVGESPKMRELFASIATIAASDLTVLVEGETGTGKDLVAEAIHKTSPRAEQPYVVFDCSAVAPNLIEAELFGHERGAFTGAVGSRPGVFEQAHTGTLFLDELGELPKELQPKLLRALEKGEIRRVGGTRAVRVDVRFVAATNRNLLAEVERGVFRQDLYYRVAAARIAVPPLRDRMDDLPRLVKHFLSEDSRPGVARELPADVWEQLRSYSWPGNVRELRNVVRYIALAPDHRPPILAVPTPPPTQGLGSGLGPGAGARTNPSLPLSEARRVANDEFERAYLKEVLRQANGSVTKAAAAASVSRQMMTRLIQKHRLRDD